MHPRVLAALLSIASVAVLLLPLVPAAEVYAPHAAEDFPMMLLWGDTHVHSSFSMDASTVGNRLSPAEAYRFAKGEAVVASSGMTAKLARPLDFLVVADHVEWMGLLPALRAGDPRILSLPEGRRLHSMLQNSEAGGMSVIAVLAESLMRSQPLVDNAEFKPIMWRENTRLADEANDPGRFTALIGFEWTSWPGGDNLHRVVVYGDDAEKAARLAPVSAYDGDRPEDLWAFMERYEAETGGRILAIPHNANLSNGRMFAIEDSEGRPFDRAYSERRARHEPIVEVTQMKGDGEAHPLLSPDDEFADFETWDFGNLNINETAPQPLPLLHPRVPFGPCVGHRLLDGSGRAEHRQYRVSGLQRGGRLAGFPDAVLFQRRRLCWGAIRHFDHADGEAPR